MRQFLQRSVRIHDPFYIILRSTFDPSTAKVVHLGLIPLFKCKVIQIQQITRSYDSRANVGSLMWRSGRVCTCLACIPHFSASPPLLANRHLFLRVSRAHSLMALPFTVLRHRCICYRPRCSQTLDVPPFAQGRHHCSSILRSVAQDRATREDICAAALQLRSSECSHRIPPLKLFVFDVRSHGIATCWP